MSVNEPQAALVSCRALQGPRPPVITLASLSPACVPAATEGCLTKQSSTQPPFTCTGASQQPLRGLSRDPVTALVSTAGWPEAEARGRWPWRHSI